MTETESRLAKLETAERFYRDMAKDAKESSDRLWAEVSRVNSEFLSFKTEVAKEISKVMVKVAIITGSFTTASSILVSIILRKWT